MFDSLKTRVLQLINHYQFERLVIIVIIANSIVLGLETYRPFYEENKLLFTIIDTAFLCFFVGELALRMYAHRWQFFKIGWNWFDFIIVMVSLIPFFGNLSALRALRILRALRLLSAIPEFRDITESLLRAGKGAGAVFGILGLLLYVFAVLSSKLFGSVHPELFGNLEASLLTHVQLMVFDGWGDTVRTVITTSGFMVFWYFLFFSLIVGFVLVSMLVGIIVEAKQSVSNEDLLAELKRIKIDIFPQ
jgi:voltage-gated sodium channel